MPADTALRTAIREGIGGRLIELGFRRKSERFYEKDEGDLYYWVRFELSDEGFVDWAGIRSKKLEALFASCGPDLPQYNTNTPADGHLYNGAILQWRWESSANFDTADSTRSRLNPLNWFVNWKRDWALSDLYTQSPYVDRGCWAYDDDPEGCAAASLAQWRRTVESWLLAMRDPIAFADWYCNGHAVRLPDIICSFPWACAGDKDRAQAYLRRAYRLRPYTRDEAYRGLRPSLHFFMGRRARQALEVRVERQVKMATTVKARGRIVADVLNLDLGDHPAD